METKTLYFIGGDHDLPVFSGNWSGRKDDRAPVVLPKGAIPAQKASDVPWDPIRLSGNTAGIALLVGKASIPSIVVVGLIVNRTYREDQMLIVGLKRYSEFVRGRSSQIRRLAIVKSIGSTGGLIWHTFTEAGLRLTEWQTGRAIYNSARASPPELFLMEIGAPGWDLASRD